MDSGTQNLAGADETRAPLLIGMTSGVLTLTLVFVLLRAYVRAIVLKKWGPDDTLVVVAFVSVQPFVSETKREPNIVSVLCLIHRRRILSV